jgi:hypothetical protein
VLGGTWTSFDPPEVSKMSASNDGHAGGLGDGDAVLITFNMQTNKPPVASKANIDSLLTFTSSKWIDSTKSKVTIISAPTSHFEETRVGALQVTTRSAGGLVSADQTSQPSSCASPSLEGSWGQQLPPSISSITAFDEDCMHARFLS